MKEGRPSIRQRRSTIATAPRAKLTGTLTATLVLAIAVIVSVVGSIVTDAQVRSAFTSYNQIDEVQSRVEGLFRNQLDEESGLRGFLTTGERLFLEPYTAAEPGFDAQWTDLRNESIHAGLDADSLLIDLRRTHDEWVTGVAQPLIAEPNSSLTLPKEQLGKLLIDHMRADFKAVTDDYSAVAAATANRVQSLLIRASASTAALILLFGFVAIVADNFRTRTEAELERERNVADTLQQAFLSGWDSVPYLRVGTAYVSSTREAAVGGDIFDIFRIDDHRSLVLVADVSGKGLEAAVETAQVKYSIRTLAVEHTDPAVVMARFNRSFLRSVRDLSSFVSIFAGIFDDRDRTLRYASAGHAPAYVRRGNDVEQIPVTGPVVGLTEDGTFSSVTVSLDPGDTIVLATDGLTEARDSSGVAVDDEGVMRWIRDGAREPQALAAELVALVSRFAGGKINDDLALIILQLAPSVAKVATPDPSPVVSEGAEGRSAPGAF